MTKTIAKDNKKMHHALHDELSADMAPVTHRKQVTREKKTAISYFMTLEMHRVLKRAAVDNNTSMQQLLDEAVDLLFTKYMLGQFVPVPPTETRKGQK